MRQALAGAAKAKIKRTRQKLVLGLDCIGLYWIVLYCIGLDWIGLDLKIINHLFLRLLPHVL